jgi:hypothetical protein
MSTSVLVQGSSENADFLQKKLRVLPPGTDLVSVMGALTSPVVLLKETNTHTSGMIRCFRVGKTVVVEETDIDTKEVIWRPMIDEDEATAFFADREETYEALWGGA